MQKLAICRKKNDSIQPGRLLIFGKEHPVSKIQDEAVQTFERI